MKRGALVRLFLLVVHGSMWAGDLLYSRFLAVRDTQHNALCIFHTMNLNHIEVIDSVVRRVFASEYDSILRLSSDHDGV